MNKGRYGVVVCTKCKNAKGVDLISKNTRCTRCGKQLSLRKLNVYFRSDSQTEIASKVGELNAKLRDVDITPEHTPKSDPHTLAVKESSFGSNERERLSIIARVLTRELGSFGREDIQKIIEIKGTGDINEMIESLKKLDDVYEPEREVFKSADL